MPSTPAGLTQGCDDQTDNNPSKPSRQLGEGVFKRGPTRSAVLLDQGSQARPTKPADLPPAKKARTSETQQTTHHSNYRSRSAQPPEPWRPPPSFQRSSTPSHQPAPSTGVSRLHKAVLGGLLFNPECRNQMPQLYDQIPDSFYSSDHYLSVFEPLLHEEARESLKNSYQEAVDAGKGWSVGVQNLIERGSGWCQAVLVPKVGSQHGDLLRPETLVILEKPVHETQAIQEAGVRERSPSVPRGECHRVACIVKLSNRRVLDPITVDLHPTCPYHDPEDRSCPCMQVCSMEQTAQQDQPMPQKVKWTYNESTVDSWVACMLQHARPAQPDACHQHAPHVA